jgi:hypothetical protein
MGAILRVSKMLSAERAENSLAFSAAACPAPFPGQMYSAGLIPPARGSVSHAVAGRKQVGQSRFARLSRAFFMTGGRDQRREVLRNHAYLCMIVHD